ncbi:MAG: hypothetical protein ABJ242_08375 [Marinomonas sp.]
MRLFSSLMAAFAVVAAMPAVAQEPRTVVDASAATDLSVTVYRDPNRREGQKINKNWPRGFAMISETRTVTLPAGISKIRFEGVAEGMVAVSAIVTGLPGGTIEKNRNAALLSPASLVNGNLGNLVQITRTNPGTGEAKTEDAFVRTRADGGLVLETQGGFEAIRCAGLPEKLTFDGVPAGLSAKPIYSVNTNSPRGGTYEVVLTYISWGFDWQANYVGTLGESSGEGDFEMGLLSWLTLVNNNGQSFDNAKLLVIAGKLNVQSNYRALAATPRAAPIRLRCFPIGSTSSGSPISNSNFRDEIKVTASRRNRDVPMMMEAAAPVAVMGAADARAQVMKAVEENLGDLKLYRVPKRVDVSAKGMKQVAFLNEDAVKARYIYRAPCSFAVTRAGVGAPGFFAANMLLVTKNEEERGLGMALPQGGLSVFEPNPRGSQLVAETNLRDYAEGQDVELPIGSSSQVFAKCIPAQGPVTEGNMRKWFTMGAKLTNANSHAVRVRMELGESGGWEARFKGAKTRLKDGKIIAEVNVPANGERQFSWRIRSTE